MQIDACSFVHFCVLSLATCHFYGPVLVMRALASWGAVIRPGHACVRKFPSFLLLRASDSLAVCVVSFVPSTALYEYESVIRTPPTMWQYNAKNRPRYSRVQEPYLA